jgi:NAD(P)-dependent dehydrogenase (short-subunit alcohol dehydrogenase family)
MIMAALAQKTVVVVGGTSGMGRGIVHASAQAGAKVIAFGRRSPGGDVTYDGGGSIHYESLDMTDDAAIAAAFARIGQIDHLLVTATPPGGGGKFVEQSYEQAQSILTGKLLGSWSCARHAVAHMSSSSSITFTTGGVAVKPRSGAAMISAAFAGVEALTRALALELGPIRVNALRPGVIESEMWSSMPEADRTAFFDGVKSRFPVRRAGTVEDIGHAAVFLMTNSYVTGAILEVTGGETLVELSL